MTVGALAALAGVWLVTIVVPGPDLVQILRAGMRSTTAGIYCALGVTTGITIWLLLSIAGMSAVIAANPSILVGLQIVGGCYLVYMGLSALWGVWRTRSRGGEVKGIATTDATRAGGGVVDPGFSDEAEDDREQSADAEAGELGKFKAFRMGLLSDLANPKTVVFFGAVFAQFFTPDMTAEWTLAVIAVLLVETIAWVMFFAIMVRAVSRWLMRYHLAVDAVAGAILAALGGVILGEGIKALARAT